VELGMLGVLQAGGWKLGAELCVNQTSITLRISQWMSETAGIVLQILDAFKTNL